MQQVQFGVVFDLQDMGVSADEQLRGLCVEDLPDGRVVFTRVSSDVFHQYVGSFQLESVDFRKTQSQVLSVDIAVYRPEGTEGSQAVGHFL